MDIDPWKIWMRRLLTAGKRFIEEEPILVDSDEERELVALKCALFARALTIFSGALLLIEYGRELDFRIHSRGIIECTIYLVALDHDPSFVNDMKDDDYSSRFSRATLHLKSGAVDTIPEAKTALEEFVAHGKQGAKPLQLSSALDGTQFERLYRTYRDMSGDAAHVSTTSLNRHYVENPRDRSATLTFHPILDDADMAHTLKEMNVSLLIAVFLLMKIKNRTKLWDTFQTLVSSYHELIRQWAPVAD